MAYKHLNDTGVLWLITKIKNGLAEKVDKVDGKGLSTNDFTNDLKTAYDKAVEDVANIKAEGGEPNKIDSISVNGTAVTPDSKKNVDLTITPADTIKTDVMEQVTAKGYQTASDVDTAIVAKGYQTSDEVQTAINEALEGISGIDIQVVTALPTTGEKGVIYLIAHSHSDEGDTYDEYVWVSSTSTFEKIGNTDVDLSEYVKSADITDITESELATMWNA